jgi:hypothetical protein
MADARLTQVKNLVITYWHGDHYGGPVELAMRIPIRHFIDHGPNVQPAPAVDDFLAKVYPQLYGERKAYDRQTGRQDFRGGSRCTSRDAACETIKAPFA